MERPIVMVTGSNRNTGLGIVRYLAGHGFDVVCSARNRKNADDTVNLLRNEYPDARVWGAVFDQSDPTQIHDAFQELSVKIPHLDGLVCNATITGRQKFIDIRPEEMSSILLTNVNGYLFCAQEAAKLMIPRKKGSIVMISSVQSKGAVPHMMAYAASKAAINSISRSIALEMAQHHIRCNALIAGAIRVDSWNELTDEQIARKRANWPLGKEALPEDIAQSIRFLLSDESSLITGTELTVDSGLSMSLLPYNAKWEEK